MIRTQISLEPDEASWLKREAKARKTTITGVIRNMIRDASARKESRASKRPPGNLTAAGVKRRHPWVGICKDGPATDASLADEYLYGEENGR